MTSIPRTQITRLGEYAVHDRAVLDALLDTARVGHVGLVDDGWPVVIPTAVARDGEQVIVHGSTGSRWLRALADGAPACITVTSMHGLVLARSAFESSMHYRSAVLFGTCTALEGAAKTRSLDVLTDTLIPGRVAELRRPTRRELAATLILAMPIERWSLKVAEGWPEDPDSDVAGPAWAGVVPMPTVYGDPQPAPDLRPGIDVPDSVRALET
jgi:uncharacterized protein